MDGQMTVENVTEVPAKAKVTQAWVRRVFADRNGGRLAHCHSDGAWLGFDGSVWRRQTKPDAFHAIALLAAEMSADAMNREKMQEAGWVAAVERLCKADPIFSRSATDWDQNPWLAGAPSCTMDLKTGMGIKPDPAYGITKSLAVAPADVADCPLWLAFVDQTFGGDSGLIRLVQQYLGYCLTGDTSEQVLVFGFGPGGNGKGVFLNTVSAILGDYAMPAPMETFTSSKWDRHPTEIAMLRGARLVTASETEEGRAWAEARIKLLTGGDVVQARFMRGDFFSFKPAFKLFITGNHKPTLKSVDDAMRRRLIMVPFSYKPDQPDPQLERRLVAEWPATLRWMIEGCMDWQNNGLVRPEIVERETETYFNDQDLFGQWIDEECDAEPGNARKWESSLTLFTNWAAYAETRGEPAGNLKSFADAMRCRGFEKHRGTGGRNGFRGIQLKSPFGRAE